MQVSFRFLFSAHCPTPRKLWGPTVRLQLFAWQSWSQRLALKYYGFKFKFKVPLEWRDTLGHPIDKGYIWSSYDYRWNNWDPLSHRSQNWGFCHHCSMGHTHLARNWMSIVLWLKEEIIAPFCTILNCMWVDLTLPSTKGMTWGLLALEYRFLQKKWLIPTFKET